MNEKNAIMIKDLTLNMKNSYCIKAIVLKKDIFQKQTQKDHIRILIQDENQDKMECFIWSLDKIHEQIQENGQYYFEDGFIRQNRVNQKQLNLHFQNIDGKIHKMNDNSQQIQSKQIFVKLNEVYKQQNHFNVLVCIKSVNQIQEFHKFNRINQSRDIEIFDETITINAILFDEIVQMKLETNQIIALLNVDIFNNKIRVNKKNQIDQNVDKYNLQQIKSYIKSIKDFEQVDQKTMNFEISNLSTIYQQESIKDFTIFVQIKKLYNDKNQKQDLFVIDNSVTQDIKITLWKQDNDLQKGDYILFKNISFKYFNGVKELLFKNSSSSIINYKNDASLMISNNVQQDYCQEISQNMIQDQSIINLKQIQELDFNAEISIFVQIKKIFYEKNKRIDLYVVDDSVNQEIKMTLWQFEQDVEIGDYILCQNISIKNFNGVKELVFKNTYSMIKNYKQDGSIMLNHNKFETKIQDNQNFKEIKQINNVQSFKTLLQILDECDQNLDFGDKVLSYTIAFITYISIDNMYSINCNICNKKLEKIIHLENLYSQNLFCNYCKQDKTKDQQKINLQLKINLTDHTGSLSCKLLDNLQASQLLRIKPEKIQQLHEAQEYQQIQTIINQVLFKQYQYIIQSSIKVFKNQRETLNLIKDISIPDFQIENQQIYQQLMLNSL